MGRLDHAKIYLCGQVEADNDCASWRLQIAKTLRSVNPTLIVWDPLIKPQWMSEDARSNVPIDLPSMFGPKSAMRTRVFAVNSEIRQVCQGLAGAADIIIARIIHKFTWGSIDELEIAARRQIPVFFHLPGGPLGLYGMPGTITNPDLMNEYIHYNQASLLDKLHSIDNGQCDLPNRDPLKWLYLTYPNAIKH